MNIIWTPSPNFTPGRGGNTIDKIVIHWTDSSLSSAVQHFQTDGSKPPYVGVSAHFVVEDATIVQCVRLDSTAWHAHNFLVNQQSIGIECSATPSRVASEATYETVSELIATVCHQLGLTPSRALLHKHSEYFNTECSGTMDLDRIASRAVELFTPQQDTPLVPSVPGILAVAHIVPVQFSITIAVPLANFRTGPGLSFPIVRQYPTGTSIECSDSVKGESINGNDVWYKSSLHGYFISATVCNHN